MDEYMVPDSAALMECGREFLSLLGQGAVARLQAGL